MVNQIIDKKTVAIPGPVGDVTPAALAARDAAQGFRDQAETARDSSEGYRDEAEAFVSGAVEFQDASVAGLISTSETETSYALNNAIYASTVSGLPVIVNSVDEYRMGELSEVLDIPTYDGSDKLVHPSVLFFPQGWNGHRYWMVMTPYPNANNRLENPSIVVSNDGDTWSVPAGVTNPLVSAPPAPGYLSDPDLVMGPDGRMYIMYRSFIENVEEYLVMSSNDGIEWTTPVVVMSGSAAVSRPMSPAVWFDGGANEWVMLAVEILGTPHIVRYTASSIYGPWSPPTDVVMLQDFPPGRRPWHLEARYVNGTVVALIQDGSNAGGDLYLATSADQGRSLRVSPHALAKGTYRSTFVTTLYRHGIEFDVWVGYLNGVVRRGTASELERIAVPPIILATNRIEPYVLGDNYLRPDNVSSLGVATSGQEYTIWSGNPGIMDGKAYTATAANTKAVVDTGLQDGTASLDIKVANPTGQAWLMFRAMDSNNYIRAGRQNNQWQLQTVVNGSTTGYFDLRPPSAVLDSQTLKVVYSGSNIKMFVEGELLAEVNISDLSTKTFVGFQLDNVSERVTNLICSR